MKRPLLILLVGCALMGTRGPANMPADQGLGETLFEGRVTREITLLAADGEDPAVFVLREEGYDEHLQPDTRRLEVWLDDLSVVVDGPELGWDTPVEAVSAFGDAQAAALIGGELQVLSADGWSSLGEPPQERDDLVVLSDSWAVASSEDSVWVHDGGWSELDVPAGARPVSWDDGVLVLAWIDAGLCEATWSASQGLAELGCLEEVWTAGAVLPGLNGSLDDHQVLTVDGLDWRGDLLRVVQVQGQQVQVGWGFEATRARHAPGASTLLVEHRDLAEDGAPVPSFYALECAELVGFQDDFYLDRVCACSVDADPDCPCISRELLSAVVLPTTDQQLRIVSVDALDSLTRIQALELPFAGRVDPLHEPQDCAIECSDFSERCDQQAWGLAACEFVNHDTDITGDEPPNYLILYMDDLPLENNVQVELSVSSEPSGADYEVLSDVTPRPALILEPDARFTVRVEAPGLEPMTVVVDSGPPGFSQSVDPSEGL